LLLSFKQQRPQPVGRSQGQKLLKLQYSYARFCMTTTTGLTMPNDIEYPRSSAGFSGGYIVNPVTTVKLNALTIICVSGNGIRGRRHLVSFVNMKAQQRPPRGGHVLNLAWFKAG